MSQEFGSFQIFVKQSDQYATGAGGTAIGQYSSYPVNLVGNYRLTLKGIQVHIYPDITEANTIPIEISSPNFIFGYGPVKQPVILYPMSANNKYNGNFDMSYTANLQSNIQIQLRNHLTKEPLSDLVYAVLNWNYEKLSY
jgi:hypothetical protein